MLLIKYIYQIGVRNNYEGSMMVKSEDLPTNKYQQRNLVCRDLLHKLNRFFDVYDVEIVSIEAV